MRLQIESTADEVARRRHEMKKKRLSANHIADSMITSIGSVVEDGKNVVAEHGEDGVSIVPKKGSDSDITVCTVEEEEEEEKEE